MGFAGNLRTLSLPEVVQTLARIQATGILRLAADEGHRDVVFNAGTIIGVEFTSGAERQALLQRMIMQGKLDATAAAAITAAGSETQVVRGLVEKGLVSEDEVIEARQCQAEEELISLCTWEAADFVFHDAGPEEPEATDLVAKWSKFTLTINSGSLLMEAARRMDEWARLKERIPDSGIVFGVANGQDEGFAKASTDYPAMAVVPLVDAIRTIEDIVKDAVVTRLEVYQVLAGLLDKKLVCQLSREDLLAHADYWKEQHNNQLAARLYRRSLAIFPSDNETQIKLGACLEYIGDQDEAAACYGQLARGFADEGDPARASEFARHAVSLRPEDPKLRQILARCHFARGDTVAAAAELKEIARIYLELGQLEDARGTCLKILEINKGDEYARRELARIFSRVEKDNQSEDVVVCVQCGTVNHREAHNCTSCKASLQLTCLSCGRVVAVSDRLCIFCGANPHAGGAGRRAGGSPSTSRIINRNGRRSSGPTPTVNTQTAAESRTPSGAQQSRGGASRLSPTINEPKPEDGGGEQIGSSTERWRADIERHLSTARANEEANNIDQALVSWREVSKLQPDNPQIIGHIKELELQLNQFAIEHDIDHGHRLSRTRHPWQAAKAYRNALHVMSADDPRSKPVSEALARAERDQRKIGLLYGSAGLILLIFGILAVRPYYQINRFNSAAEQLRVRILAMPALPPEGLVADMTEIGGSIEQLGTDAERIRGAYGDQAKSAQGTLRSSFFMARTALAEASLAAVDKALHERKPAEAERRLTTHEANFGSTEFEPQHVAQIKGQLAVLKKQFAIVDDERKNAPEKLAQALKHQSENRLGAAIAALRELSESGNPEVAADAQKALEVLAVKEAAFLVGWNQAVAFGNTDLVRCDQALASLADGARIWGREGDALRLRQEAQTRLKAAEQAYAQLGPEVGTAVLETFVAANPGAPQAVLARSRLAVLQSRIQGRDQALALFKQQCDARQYELAWQTGRDLINGYGALLQPGLVLPLAIESVPSGATVTLAGKVVGKTPMVLSWKPAYGTQPADEGDLELSAPGWLPTASALRDITKEWHLAVSLRRQPTWQVALGKAISAAYLMPDGTVLVLSGDTLASLNANGQVRWRHGLGTDDVEGGGRARLAHSPAVFPDGRMAFGLPSKDVAIIDASGNALGRVATTQEVRGRPLVYTNDMFGSDIRLAVAAEAILSGAVGAVPLRITLSDAAISGPLALEKDLDKVLVIGTVSGHLLGIQEQSRKTLWDIDLQATDISQLLRVSDTLLVTILDGSKVAAIQVRPDLASISWTHQLKAPAIGEPAVTTTGIVVAAGNSVLRYGRDGTMVPAWTLPSAAASPAAALGDIVAVGTQGGTLHVYKSDTQIWATPCGQPVTAVVVLKDRVIAGLQDGTVLAFPL